MAHERKKLLRWSWCQNHRPHKFHSSPTSLGLFSSLPLQFDHTPLPLPLPCQGIFLVPLGICLPCYSPSSCTQMGQSVMLYGKRKKLGFGGIGKGRGRNWSDVPSRTFPIHPRVITVSRTRTLPLFIFKRSRFLEGPGGERGREENKKFPLLSSPFFFPCVSQSDRSRILSLSPPAKRGDGGGCRHKQKKVEKEEVGGGEEEGEHYEILWRK